MKSKTMLCADSVSCAKPDDLGLEGENFDHEPWLSVFSDALRARAAIGTQGPFEDVWVVSSDDMDGINLAAALKQESKRSKVSLVSFGASGSVSSRCRAAGIGLIRGQSEFVRCYAAQKESNARVPDQNGLDCSGEIFEEYVLDEPLAPNAGEEPAESTESKDLPASQGEGENAYVFDEVVPSRLVGNETKRATPKVLGRAQAISQAVFSSHSECKEGVVIAVIGGAGGVGKSSISASLATHLQAIGKKTLLVDADLQFGDIAYLMGCEDALDVAELMARPEKVSQLEARDNLPALIACPKHLEESEVIAGRMGEFIGYLRGFFEAIVVNTGAFWSEQHAQIIEAADTTLFVLDQRPSSVRACLHALDLCSRCGIATGSFVYVLNGCSRQALLTSLDVSCALKGAHVEEVKDGGAEVAELLGAGLPVELVASKNAFSQSIRHLCEVVMPDLLGQTKEQAITKRRKFDARRVVSGFRQRRVACL